MADPLQLMLMLWWRRKRSRASRRCWVHTIFQRRKSFGEYQYHHLMEEILDDESKCVAYIRMKPATFRALLTLIGPYVEKRKTNLQEPLSSKERLVITLRYLASGESHSSLFFHFRTGISTVRATTAETCSVLWEVLQPEVMPKPDEEHWLKIVLEFYFKFDFPLCLGALDGKHIRIKKPRRSGSKYFNYTHYFSIVLLALTDANGKFVVVHVGSCGGNSDGGVFGRSGLGKRMLSNKLSVPQKCFFARYRH